ncbi:MAG: hypothetical protein P9M06_03395, partial [Candidatus Saelkia tenebricola]|nr:hypothetical protein [Candidatus Saelkia tenebricola]
MKNNIWFLFLVILITGLISISFAQETEDAENNIIEIFPVEAISVDGDVQDWVKSKITAVKGLKWYDQFSKPVDKESLRIKSVLITYDYDNLYILFYINPGVEEYFKIMKRSGAIGYVFIDSDNSDTTGARRNMKDEYAGYDFRIYLSTGFSGTVGTGFTRSSAEYNIERVKGFILEKTQYGDEYVCEYEDVYQGNKISDGDSEYISFEGKFLELSFPFELLDIKIPGQVGLVIQDISSTSKAQTKL